MSGQNCKDSFNHALLTMQGLNDREAAKVLGLSPQTLRNWRAMRRGPVYRKLHRRVVYLVADLQAFLEARRIAPGEEI